MKFGQYAMIDPIVHHFDKEPKWWWKITPPTSGDELAMSKFYLEAGSMVKPDGTRVEQIRSNTEVAHREIALLFGGTNMPAGDVPVEEGGEPIVKVSDSVEQIEAVLRSMPHVMVFELWIAIAKAVPGWGPTLPKAMNTPEA